MLFLTTTLYLFILSVLFFHFFQATVSANVGRRSTTSTARWQQRCDPPSCRTRNAHQSLVGWRWVCVCARFCRNSEWTEVQPERGVTEQAFPCHRRMTRNRVNVRECRSYRVLLSRAVSGDVDHRWTGRRVLVSDTFVLCTASSRTWRGPATTSGAMPRRIPLRTRRTSTTSTAMTPRRLTS